MPRSKNLGGFSESEIHYTAKISRPDEKTDLLARYRQELQVSNRGAKDQIPVETVAAKDTSVAESSLVTTPTRRTNGKNRYLEALA